ncbi:MAG: DUF4261 domain-containing protein [Planctomycetia bacterium]|nr:DUF4261 domain-containing protein [Planctomycetia bacterium]
MSESENDPSSAIVAMLALSSDKMPKPSVVADALRIRLPDGPLPEHVEGDEGTITFHLGSAIAAISLMPVPLPWSELESPCTTAWWWPDAAEEMRDHKQHIIVALIGGEETLLSRHVLLSQLVAAVAAVTDAVGVYWGAGGLVHEPAEFIEQCDELTIENSLPHLWVDLRVEENDDGSLCFFTTGLEAFDQYEMEIERSEQSAEEILDLCYSVVHYLISSSAEIQDGESVGRTGEERVPVTHKPSKWDADRTVLSLEFH